MNTRNFKKIFLVFAALAGCIALMNTGYTRIRDLAEDKSYLTPIPQATLDAFDLGEPVHTKLQAVMAAQKGILTHHMTWTGQPTPIFVEIMDYQEAIQRIEPKGSETYYDPTPKDTPVWLVVFRGEWTITEPIGTVSAPFSGCAFAMIGEDGSEMRGGGKACESLNLGQ